MLSNRNAARIQHAYLALAFLVERVAFDTDAAKGMRLPWSTSSRGRALFWGSLDSTGILNSLPQRDVESRQ